MNRNMVVVGAARAEGFETHNGDYESWREALAK
jgi:hypothetical protein